MTQLYFLLYFQMYLQVIDTSIWLLIFAERFSRLWSNVKHAGEQKRSLTAYEFKLEDCTYDFTIDYDLY